MEGGLADKFLRDLEDLSADEEEEFKQDEGEEDMLSEVEDGDYVEYEARERKLEKLA